MKFRLLLILSVLRISRLKMLIRTERSRRVFLLLYSDTALLLFDVSKILYFKF